jgi:hypothetical protein
VKSYPTTVRRKLIDFAGKLIHTGRRIILKVSQYIYERLNISLLWERCNNTHLLLHKPAHEEYRLQKIKDRLINSISFPPQNIRGRVTMLKCIKYSKTIQIIHGIAHIHTTLNRTKYIRMKRAMNTKK